MAFSKWGKWGIAGTAGAAVFALAWIWIDRGDSNVSFLPDVLEDKLIALNWTPVDLPRELLGPGSIVSMSVEDGIRYRGSLASCLAPVDLKKIIVEGNVGLPNELSGSYEFGIGALGKLHNIASMGAKFDDLRRFEMTLESGREWAIDEIELRKAIRNNKLTEEQVCLDYLVGATPSESDELKGKIFILVNVLEISGYKYKFFDSKGANVELTLEKLNDYFSLDATEDIVRISRGNIQIEKPIFIAFKKGFFYSLDNPMGASAPGMPDAETIMRLRLEESGWLQ